MRIFKRMLVGISLLTLHLPILWAEPDPLLIYFTVTDDADEIFTPASFEVTGVDGLKVMRDVSRRPLILQKSKLRKYFVIVLPILPEGDYTITVTVTDKGGLKASKDFEVTVVDNTGPIIEDTDDQKINS